MKKITLLAPMFGDHFPNYFPLLLDSMKNNPEIQFVLPTDIDFNHLYTNLPKNIKFRRTTLAITQKKLERITGCRVILTKAYKICDYKPMYGMLFDDLIGDSEWWGYFDVDIIFGDISHWLTEELLASVDRIFTRGHLTLFRNVSTNNTLWKHNFRLPEVPSYQEVVSSPAIYAFDEWGWGKNKGRGLSYAINKLNLVNQYDNEYAFADISPNTFAFTVSNGITLSYLKYTNGKLMGYEESGLMHEFMYVHLQKRSMIYRNVNLLDSVYIFPNEFSNSLTDDNDATQEKIWRKQWRKRRIKQIIGNLSYAYFKRRIRFLKTE